MDELGGAGGPSVRVRNVSSRWAELSGSCGGRHFRTHLTVAAVNDSRTPILVTDLLQDGAVRESSALEDVVLATAALNEDIGFRCRLLPGGAHVHEYASGRDDPVLVLLHPLGGNSNNFIAVSETLRNFARVVAIDLPGHGLTTARLSDAEATANAYVSWLDGVFDALELPDHVHLVGHSLGGRVAAHYAARGARRLSSLTLIAPALRPALDGMRGFAAIAAERLAVFRRPKGISVVAGLVFFDMLIAQSVGNRRLLGLAMRDALRDQARQRYVGMRHALTWLRVEPTDEGVDWEHITARTPVVALFGEQDKYCPAERHDYLAHAGVDVRVIAKTGHLLPLEEPDLVNDLLIGQVGAASGDALR